METGHIKIIQKEGKVPTVEAQLVNGTIWMSKWSIARTFNCFNQKIEMNLRSIFKNRLLYESDVTYTYRYNDKGIEKQIEYYNLEVLIFLSYRIGTFEAKIFRQFINSSLREKLQSEELKDNDTIIWVYKPQQKYWLN